MLTVVCFRMVCSNGVSIGSDRVEGILAEHCLPFQVVCSTCVGMGSDQLEGMYFSGVLLDEASQVNLYQNDLQRIPLPEFCKIIGALATQIQQIKEMHTEEGEGVEG